MSAASFSVAGGAGAPKVSVIVPTFRRAGLLKETVDSILAQTFTDFELIIVDNMSEDGTAEYVTGLGDARVRYFRNPNHGIISVNRNVGIKRSVGSYIAFCDDDDLWHPTKLEKQVALLGGDERIGLCYSNALSFNGSGVLEQKMVRKKVFRNHYRHLFIGNFIVNSTVLLRRGIFDEYGLLSEERGYIAVEDYAMWLAIARKYALAYIDESLVYYRIHAAANSSNGQEMARKTFKVISAEFSKNGFSVFYSYALVRAYARFLYKKFQA